MLRKRYVRKKRGSSWTSESSKRANKVRWDADRLRRDAEMPDRIREMIEAEIQNYPTMKGDPIGCLQWQDYATGRVRRWIFRIGDRRDQVTMESTDGRIKKESHGWTYYMDALRGYFAGTKF